MKITNQQGIIGFNILFILYLALQSLVDLDFSSGQGLGLGLLFGVMGFVFIPFSILVIVSYLARVAKVREWTKFDYYALTLTAISIIMFLIVGNSR